jgi:PiT family inorganic phosphate transporter
MDLAIVAALIFVALVFDYINGFHDAANSIATVVSTRVLSPGKAVVWAAVFNFIAAFGFGTAVAKTMGAGMVDINVVTFGVIFSGLFGAIVWDLITWYYGLPTSSSHALIGGYAGGAVARAGFGAIIVGGWTKTLIFIVLAPTIGLVLGLLLMVTLLWLFRGTPPGRVDSIFRRVQLLSAAAYSLGHGANDAQKTMGIIAGVLFAAGYLETFYIPFWIVLSAHAAIALGTLSGGWRIIHTMGSKITRLEPVGGFAAETAGSRVALHGHRARRASQHHAHDHGRDCRRGLDTAALSRALGCRRTHRVGLGAHDSCLGAHLGRHLRVHRAARRAVGREFNRAAPAPSVRAGLHRGPVASRPANPRPQRAPWGSRSRGGDPATDSPVFVDDSGALVLPQSLVGGAVRSRSVNTAPPSERLRAEISPPSSSTRCLTMARPSPVPPGLRARDLSTR